jgi:hypothetical protein
MHGGRRGHLLIYGWDVVCNELVKEAVLLQFELVFLKLPGGTEEYHRNSG